MLSTTKGQVYDLCDPAGPMSEVLLLLLHLTNEEISADVVFLKQAGTASVLLVGSYVSFLSFLTFFLMNHQIKKKCKNLKFWPGLALGDKLFLRSFEV